MADINGMEPFIINAGCSSMEEAIALLSALQGQLGYVDNEETLRLAALRREQELSTFMGGGIALPHGRLPGILTPHLTALTLGREIDWGGQPVHTVFLLASAMDEEAHLRALSAIAKILYDML